MRTPYVAVVLRVPREIADTLAAELAALGRGVESRPVDRRMEEIRAFTSAGSGDAGPLRTWATRRLASLGFDRESFTCDVEQVDDGHWVERYQESLRPFRIGTRFTVHPRGRIEVDDGRVPLLLVPGRAFGTGEHATTQLCIERLEHVVRPGQRWLDVGCGSGILLLVARALGAGACVGIEIDPDAVEIARNVLSRNEALDCEIQEGGLDRAARGAWDGAICNISTTFARMHVAALAALPRPGGTLIVSGVLQADLPGLSSRFAGAGLHEIDRAARGPWGLLVLAVPH